MTKLAIELGLRFVTVEDDVPLPIEAICRSLLCVGAEMENIECILIDTC